MSENWLPKDWREAIPNVVWVVLVLGFGLELVAALVRGEWPRAGVSFGGLVLLMALVIHWDHLRALAKAGDAKFVVLLMVVALIALPLSSYFRAEMDGAVSWGLIVLAAVSAALAAVLSFRNLRPKLTSQQAATPVASRISLDGQTRLDLIHLLNFGVNETTYWMLDRLVELAVSPEVTDGLEHGPYSDEAHKARQWFIGYVRQELGTGFRRDDYHNLLLTAQGQAESDLEATPQEERPKGVDPLLVRRCHVSEAQFKAAVRFISNQRTEVRDRLVSQRHQLLERMQLREGS